MLYIPKIDEYLEIMTDDEVKGFVATNVSESINEQNLQKVAKSLYIFVTAPDKVQSNSFDNFIHHYKDKTLNLFDQELKLINTKPVIEKQIERIVK